MVQVAPRQTLLDHRLQSTSSPDFQHQLRKGYLVRRLGRGETNIERRIIQLRQPPLQFGPTNPGDGVRGGQEEDVLLAAEVRMKMGLGFGIFSGFGFGSL
ncbi:unnamed protein product [Linum trigynum]|uniref:Uncharacterized protein n=1 Tax=Linum trigynum TaxID=586398 RepID=A0AAV2FY31_9ROSI